MRLYTHKSRLLLRWRGPSEVFRKKGPTRSRIRNASYHRLLPRHGWSPKGVSYQSQTGKRWMARAAKLAVFVMRDVSPFDNAIRSMACGAMRGTCHLRRVRESSRASFWDNISKRSSRLATCLRVGASSDCAVI